MRIGIALSGGGHRASVWGVGVLVGVVDAGLGSGVVSVSSVSGGSITNGVVAQNVDLRTATPEEFDDAVRAALRNYAKVGLFPNGPLTKGYLRGLIAVAVLALFTTIAFVAGLAALGRGLNPWWFLLVGLVVALVMLLLRQSLVVVVAAAAVIGLVAVGGAAATTYVDGWAAGAIIASLGGVSLMFWVTAAVQLARRGSVVRSALDRTHFGATRRLRGTRLADVDRPVNHVILATDLEAGDQFYLAPRFLYGYREGVADPRPVETTIADAVQASAALPGAFPAVRLLTGSFRRPWDVPRDEPTRSPNRVWLSDGGVYDNMAEQWESGIGSRIRRWPELSGIQEPADVLVVANSSAGWGWSDFGAPGWPAREVRALLRDQGVQYDVSTARRRRALVQTWMRNEEVGRGQQGVIVMIDRSPYRLLDGFAEGDDDRSERARRARNHLGDDEASRLYWADLAASNTSVPTVLDAIGVEPTLDLIEHAYVSTLVGLYVLYGIGELPTFDRERFRRLIEGGDEATA